MWPWNVTVHPVGQYLQGCRPSPTLQRGYAIVTTDDGRTVASIADVEPDETIIARLIDGDIAAAVIDVEPHQHAPEPLFQP